MGDKFKVGDRVIADGETGKVVWIERAADDDDMPYLVLTDDDCEALWYEECELESGSITVNMYIDEASSFSDDDIRSLASRLELFKFAEPSPIVENGKARPPQPSDFGAAYEKAGVVPGDRVAWSGKGDGCRFVEWDVLAPRGSGDLYVALHSKVYGDGALSIPMVDGTDGIFKLISRARLEPEAVSWSVGAEPVVASICPRCTQLPLPAPEGFVCGVCGYPGLKSTVAAEKADGRTVLSNSFRFTYNGLTGETSGWSARTEDGPPLDSPGTLWDQSRVWRPPLYQAKPCKCGAVGGCMCRRDK